MSKLPLTAVQVMNHDLLRFFEEHRVRVKTVLSDNGREVCGRPGRQSPRTSYSFSSRTSSDLTP